MINTLVLETIGASYNFELYKVLISNLLVLYIGVMMRVSVL